MSEHRFPKRLHLLRASDFERVFAARNSAANPWLSLHGTANDIAQPRLGITVSRRVGNAVARNRWKRLIRESFRLTRDKLPALDLVCVARSPSPPTLAQLMEMIPAMAVQIERRACRKSGNAGGPNA
jgi:ribonuclease P protein component